LASGMRYWTVFDRDLTPEGYTQEETFAQLDEVIDLVMELQQRTGIKPLWFGCNLFSHPR
jgi:xylose isomerase